MLQSGGIVGSVADISVSQTIFGRGTAGVWEDYQCQPHNFRIGATQTRSTRLGTSGFFHVSQDEIGYQPSNTIRRQRLIPYPVYPSRAPILNQTCPATSGIPLQTPANTKPQTQAQGNRPSFPASILTLSIFVLIQTPCWLFYIPATSQTPRWTR